MKIRETCSCDAEIEIDNYGNKSTDEILSNWRKEHIHPLFPAMDVGYAGSDSFAFSVTDLNLTESLRKVSEDPEESIDNFLDLCIFCEKTVEKHSDKDFECKAQKSTNGKTHFLDVMTARNFILMNKLLNNRSSRNEDSVS